MWFPLLAWMSEGLTGSIRAGEGRRKTLRWTLGLSIALVLQVLAGHPQLFFYSLVFTGIWLLARAWPGREGRWLRLGWVFGLVVGAGLLAACACAAQLLPTLEYIGWSSRGEGLNYDEATQFSFSPSRLLALPLPDLFGSQATRNYWAYWKDWSSAYMGVWPPLLALIALIQAFKVWRLRKSLEVKDSFPLIACLVLGLIAVLLAMGRHHPLYRLVMQLPGFEYFRAPSKFLPYFILPVALLAGRGWDLLGQGKRPSWRVWVVFPLLMAVAGGLAILLEGNRFSSAHCPIAIRTGLLALAIYGAGLIGLLFAHYHRQPFWRGLFIFAFFVAALLDLYLYSEKYFQFANLGDRLAQLRRVFSEPLKEGGSGRVDSGPVIGPNEAMAVGVETAGYYDPLSVRHYSQWMRYYEGLPPEGSPIVWSPRSIPGLPCRWLVSDIVFQLRIIGPGGSGWKPLYPRSSSIPIYWFTPRPIPGTLIHSKPCILRPREARQRCGLLPSWRHWRARVSGRIPGWFLPRECWRGDSRRRFGKSNTGAKIAGISISRRSTIRDGNTNWMEANIDPCFGRTILFRPCPRPREDIFCGSNIAPCRSGQGFGSAWRGGWFSRVRGGG